MSTLVTDGVGLIDPRPAAELPRLLPPRPYTPWHPNRPHRSLHHRGHPAPLAILPALRWCLRFGDLHVTVVAASRGGHRTRRGVAR